MTFLNEKFDILISAAVKDELQLLISKALNLNSYLINKTEVSTGTINNKHIVFVTTGPGVINTAHALTLVLEKTQPNLIIQTGCAGAFEDSGIKTGDVGIATCEIDVHTGIEHSEGEVNVPTALPFPLFTKNNTNYTNRFSTDEELSEKAFSTLSKNNKESFKIVKAPFITVSTITATDKRKETLYLAYKPCMESMEGSSAAHISMLYDIPFIEIRSASNLVGKRDKSKWDLPLAFKNCNLAVLDILNNMDDLIPIK